MKKEKIVKYSSTELKKMQAEEKSKTAWEKVRNKKDKDIVFDDSSPELTDEFWKNAKIDYPSKKSPVTIRLDSDVLAWFKSQGKGYQTKINAVLKSYVSANN